MQESKSSIWNDIGIVLATMVIIIPLFLYFISNIQEDHKHELIILKEGLCRAYGFDHFEVYTSPFTNQSYDECSVVQSGCGGINYMPLGELTQKKGVLNHTLGGGGGGPGGPSENTEER